MLEIVPIRALKDNYIWLIIHRNSKECMIVDPGESDLVIKELQEKSLQLKGILLTHHHWDHTQGVEKILAYQRVPVYGSEREPLPFMTHLVHEGSKVGEGELFNFNILEIPGHTRGHIAYFGYGALFSGDTLFSAGCGRVFEGTALQLFNSLEKLASLPPETLIYCGHEYTEKNLQFASRVEPKNDKIHKRLEEVQSMRKTGLPTLPSTLALEKEINPFLRAHEPEVIKSAEQFLGKTLHHPIEVFSAIRQWKNIF